MEIVERLRDMQSKKYSKTWAAWVQTQCSQAADEIERLREALQSVADMTDADNPESYRCDDREGCLDTVFATATAAMTPNTQ